MEYQHISSRFTVAFEGTIVKVIAERYGIHSTAEERCLALGVKWSFICLKEKSAKIFVSWKGLIL